MLYYSWQLLKDFIYWFPARLGRLLDYLAKGAKALVIGELNLSTIPWWWFGAGLLVVDLCGGVEFYELCSGLYKSATRKLTADEVLLAEQVFGKNLHYARIRVDESAWAGPKQYHFCYVSFYTINSWGKMQDDVFIHELVHVWQYQQFGAAYIAKALMAQRRAGYDYGGLSGLKEAKAQHLSLLHFNFEQQADIVMDYYRLLKGRRPRWGTATAADIRYYQYFVDHLRNT